MTDADWPGTPKWLTPAQLIQALAEVPLDSRIVTNKVGNLAVMSNTWEFLGFIDFILEGDFERAS